MAKFDYVQYKATALKVRSVKRLEIGADVGIELSHLTTVTFYKDRDVICPLCPQGHGEH